MVGAAMRAGAGAIGLRRRSSRKLSHCYLVKPREILGYGGGSYHSRTHFVCHYLDASAAAPTAHLFFPCLDHRAVSVMCGELGIEEGETIFKGGKAPALCPVEPHIQQRLLYCTQA